MSIATLIYLLHRRKTSIPATHLPPSPPKLPIIGHLHLLTNMPHRAFSRLADQFGPIFYLQLGQVPTVVVSAAQPAELVLKAHDHVFSNRPQLVAAQYLSFGCSDVTFSKYGPYWRQARKICVTELLSPKRVNSFEVIRDEEVTPLLHVVSTRSGLEVDISALFFHLANDMLCRVAFGKRFLQEQSRGNEEKDLNRILSETQALLAGFCIGDFFPEWEWVNSVSGMRRRLMKNLKELREVCDDIINEHMKTRKESTSGDGDARKEDFVDVLLRVQRQHDLEVPITDDNLKALVLVLFSSHTLLFSLLFSYFSKYNDRYSKNRLITVQCGWWDMAETKGEIEETELHHFRYLKAVIKETMRLHPPVPLLVPRESMQKCTLQGYDIPERTRILINTYAIGRDPNSWPNPMVYDPERFVETEVDFRGQDFRFLPFGGGRRGCPGYAFGLATIELTLARLLYHFDWKLPPGTGPDDVDLDEIFGLATRKKTALKLIPTENRNYGLKKDGPRVSPNAT
ncbi:cytochrome P450 [Cynara cardunculus var. scolymus]|uniref:Cytochrome P450 n=1 Tax=Cynara cardunculus var. scolymus TaxID=59895 RepID=A0A118K3C4_CYNCS|nr:cytochrome P450 [Cynara cardunculus var. scolymus]